MLVVPVVVIVLVLLGFLAQRTAVWWKMMLRKAVAGREGGRNNRLFLFAMGLVAWVLTGGGGRCGVCDWSGHGGRRRERGEVWGGEAWVWGVVVRSWVFVESGWW